MHRSPATLWLLALCACSAPNPLFGLDAGLEEDSKGSVAGASDSGALEEGETDGASGEGGSGDGGGDGESGDVGLDPPSDVLYIFAGRVNNGSIDDDGCLAAADALALGCVAPIPLLFDAGTDRVTARLELGAQLGDVDRPIVAPDETVVAEDLDAFVLGMLTTSLSDAGIVASPAVWTGLTDLDTVNCQDWTSGNDDRTAGVASTLTTDEGWIAEDVAHCGTSLPVVCLCSTTDGSN